ncbi:chromosome condensation protein CrcB [Rhodococcus pyridinivorans SB3094]|uniref:Fluoride-specific ion channel FluC n=1 Tax=Rhodococcus pyridinivorans SB3094 TaxID=1435356 RepID=V9XIT4_9NOCA|nr:MULTISPECIES: CrcB family protein [Rhodococcus]AHD21237.1 chromosome condensation protein CrcB [Rhodococcus pyridinivorans SB3094]MCT7291289.1 CrcB family protein [Rhodococcus sp. PAE-6]
MGPGLTEGERPLPRALHLRPSALAAVAVGGLLGTSARYGLGRWFPVESGGWPVTTFAINVLGALLLGFLLEALIRIGPDTSWRQVVRLGVGTGALGSFTTYSALAVDTDLLLRDGELVAAATYALGTVLVGLLATGIGVALGTWFGSRRAARR